MILKAFYSCVFTTRKLVFVNVARKQITCSCCIARKFAPPASKCDAKEWRNTWGLTLFGSIPDNTAHFFKRMCREF